MYYRLWDLHEKRYLTSCYNSKGLKSLLKQFLEYIKPTLDPSDPDDIYSWESLNMSSEANIKNRISAWGYFIEESIKEFRPIGTYKILIAESQSIDAHN